MLRALVVDDEKPARQDLIWMLEREADIGEIAEASGGEAALKALTAAPSENRFEVVFLDMSMPGVDGLDLARIIARFEDPPAVVFVTAFDTPAAEAFDLGVVDYLRKPVASDRLERAIQRVKTMQRSTIGAPADSDIQSTRVAVPSSTGQLLLGPNDVTYFESRGDYVRVHTKDDTHLVRGTMTSFVESWTRFGFVRIHRSFAVRTSAVREVRSGPEGRTVCVGTAELPVSRRYARELTAWLGGGEVR